MTFSIVNIYTSLRFPQTSITLCVLVYIEFYPHKSHVFSCVYITRAFNLCVVFDKTKTVNSCCQHILHIFVNEVFCYIQNTIFLIVYLENVDCVFKVHIYTVGSCKSVCLNEYEFTTSKRREEQCSVFNSYFAVAIIK